MPWVPTNDFEEEVVNLQPDHDFIFGALLEPQQSYPRPIAHAEYAASQILQKNKQQKDYERTGKINGKLHTIAEVQRMANTKPVGEQPAIEDWDNNKNIEQETIGMMRYCGMGVSIEQPLNQKVTIATYPVENTIKVVRNGRKKIALFLDDSVFKMKEKVSNTSSDFESYNNSGSQKFCENDSRDSELYNDSFKTSSSLSLNSFNTVEDRSDSFRSNSSCRETPLSYKNEHSLQQYDKLVEDTSSLSLDSSISRCCNRSDDGKFLESFQSAESTMWRPICEDDESIFNNKASWPPLYGKHTPKEHNLLNKSRSDSTGDSSTKASNSSRTNFLDRFIKSEKVDTDTINISNSISTVSLQEPKSYATIVKAHQNSPKLKEKKVTSSNKTAFPHFYTAHSIYKLKRNKKK